MRCSWARTSSSGTLQFKEFLTRNGHPHAYIDLEDESRVQEMLDYYQVTRTAMSPLSFARGKTVLRNPTNQQVADLSGIQRRDHDLTKVRDVIVVGARDHQGLAAGGVLSLGKGLMSAGPRNAYAPGGQASSRLKIENCLGFPTREFPGAGSSRGADVHTKRRKSSAQRW